MAILKRCCCFDNVRSGSIASGVYSLIYCVLSFAVLLWELVDYVEVSSYTGAARKALFSAYGLDLIVITLLFISSIVLLVAVSKDKKCMLLPYTVCIPLLVVCQTISWVIVFVFMDTTESNSYIIDIAQCVAWFAITSPLIVCLLCVISQYQELSDGRGGRYDIV